MSPWLGNPVRGVLLDITGVLYNSGGSGGGIVIEGSVEAVERLKAANISVRLVTNETQSTREKLIQKLGRHGYSVNVDDVFAPAPAVSKLLKERRLSPYLLVHPGVLSEFDNVDTSSPNCVVVGDAEDHFTYDNVNKAFQTLMGLDTPILISMGKGKYYKQGDHFQLDLGAYVAGLEYSCDIKAEIVGKPSKDYFMTALNDMHVSPSEAVMVGDDIVHDIGGAQNAGIKGMLVRTGKYRPSDENHPLVKPDVIVDNLAKAVDLILS
uniref:Phospholysine phosphohistidine inorganic pyrophosphate phosphatase n=1 Tax=Strigamia maritima TaxID=126957 RepID=T1JH65_STRMM